MRQFKIDYTLTYRDGTTHTGGSCITVAESEEAAKEKMNANPHTAAGVYTFHAVKDMGPAPVYQSRPMVIPPSPYK